MLKKTSVLSVKYTIESIYNWIVYTKTKYMRIFMQTIAIVGLGNISSTYAMTRHNVGFQFLSSITDIINSRYSSNYERIRFGDFLLGDIEDKISVKHKNNCIQWIEDKNLRSYIATIGIRDFIEVFMNYPKFLMQFKFLRKKTQELSIKYALNILNSLDRDYQILLIAPTTFMNKSGDALQKIQKRFNIIKTIVVYDDLDTRFGSLNFRASGGSGGHNGLKSINEYYKDYLRVKIGIGCNIFFSDISSINVNNSMTAEFDIIKTKFIDILEERLNFNPVFKNKTIFKVMNDEISSNLKLKDNYEIFMKQFYNIGKSGMQEVSNYVLSQFSKQEKVIMPILLAYTSFVLIGAIFEYVYKIQTMDCDILDSSADFMPLDIFGIQLK